MIVHFKARRQWVALVQEQGVAADIVITRHDHSSTSKDFTWWIDATNVSPSFNAPPEYMKGIAARSLIEAKRRSIQQAKEIIARVVAARGGA